MCACKFSQPQCFDALPPDSLYGLIRTSASAGMPLSDMARVVQLYLTAADLDVLDACRLPRMVVRLAVVSAVTLTMGTFISTFGP